MKLVEVTSRGIKVSRIEAPTTYSVWVKDAGEWNEVSAELTYGEAKGFAVELKTRENFERVTFLPTGTDASRLN